jgi:16S rRNA processing protein RimM
MKIDKGEFLGTVSSTYGKQGEILIKFNPDLYNVLEKTELLLIEIDNQMVPFFVKNIEFRSKNSALIKFFDYNSDLQVENLVGCKIYSDKNYYSKSESEYNDEILIGFKVIDNKYGELGIADSIVRIENNPLIKVINKQKEILIPAHKTFITNINKKKKIISVNIPEELINL